MKENHLNVAEMNFHRLDPIRKVLIFRLFDLSFLLVKFNSQSYTNLFQTLAVLPQFTKTASYRNQQ